MRVNETPPKKTEIKANPVENPKKYISQTRFLSF